MVKGRILWRFFFLVVICLIVLFGKVFVSYLSLYAMINKSPAKDVTNMAADWRAAAPANLHLNIS